MRTILLVLATVSLSTTIIAKELEIRGAVTVPKSVQAPVRVWSMAIRHLEHDRLVRPTHQDIFAASSSASQMALANESGRYALPIRKGTHCVFGYADVNENGKWDPQVPEPFGWYAEEASGTYAAIAVDGEDATDIDFAISAPQHFPKAPQTVAGGSLRNIKGYTVLQLRGDARTRGYAHGNLLARKIVDFFRYYILEAKLQSAEHYQRGFACFLNSHFAYPEPFGTECKAVIEGMKASGADIFVPELGRDFSLTDLYAINAYIETRAMRSSCTQFAAWGERTRSTDVDGGMITGRNMDGEIDLRKVTVSHFLLMAIDPVEPGQHRYVSMMWPGFVGTISGFNEQGLYAMENAGLTGPGPVVDRLVPFSWTMRECLARLGADATPRDLQQLVDFFDNSAGGTCGPGCITLFAMPYRGQSAPAFVLEGDRFGDEVRQAEAAAPHVPQALVASNHHRRYGVDVGRPGKVFDKQPSFSSLWRYEAGMHKLLAWHRTSHKIGTSEMQELLQTVAHGTTEYAIITRPNALEFDVAVASMQAEMWDAPYREWTTFQFEEVFPSSELAGE